MAAAANLPNQTSISIRKPIISQKTNSHRMALLGRCPSIFNSTPKLSGYLDNVDDTYKYTEVNIAANLTQDSTAQDSTITHEDFMEYLQNQLKSNPNKEYLIKSNTDSYYLKCKINNVCADTNGTPIFMITLCSNNNTFQNTITRNTSLFKLYESNRFFEIVVNNISVQNNTPTVMNRVPSAKRQSAQPSAPSEIDIRINDAIKFMKELQNGTNLSNGNHVGVFKTEDAEKVNEKLHNAMYFGYIYYYFTYEEAGLRKKLRSFFGSNSNYEKKYSWRLIIVDRHYGNILEIEITPCTINGEFCMCIKDVKSLPDFMRKSLDNFIKTLPPDVIKKFSKIPVAIFIKILQPISILPNIQLKGGKSKKTRVRRSKKSKRNTKRHRK